jgi:preprotein translocase subunit SecA
MFDLTLPSASLASAYPELPRAHPSLFDRIAAQAAAPLLRSSKAWRVRRTPIAAEVNAHAQVMRKLSAGALRVLATQVRTELREDSLARPAVAKGFALIREVSDRVLGKRHFDCQLEGGWILLNGLIAEMETGEGKTLTATLPACTAALAGVPVHVITVNDYLTARDAELMRPLYEALGLSVGVVVHGMEPPARRAAYACDVTYCTNKELTFDYLRDRMALGRHDSRVQLNIERLARSDARSSKLVLRGLYFAIVDEADSVLIDEARTPLVISGIGDQAPELEMYTAALDTAARLEPGRDYRIDERERLIELTADGKDTLEALVPELPPALRGAQRREELVSQALQATLLFERDKHYLVREGKVQIIDEFTGRILADRTWEQGLHQMVEAKEGCPLSNRQTSIARITYQRFFRRYLWLAGMTGTAQEVAKELWSVYRLPVVRVPTNRPVRRIHRGTSVFATEAQKWEAVVARVRELHGEGKPVLIGTRSVVASEQVSNALSAAGIAHELLNARQDQGEADIVARAGEPGRVTVATNMAGRGTDIGLGKGVVEQGGLHVISTELHESARIDRQLYGRCARQGDPGVTEAMVSLEDELIRLYLGGSFGSNALLERSHAGQSYARGLFRLAQARAELANAGIRKQLLKADEQLGDLLAFSGRGE